MSIAALNLAGFNYYSQVQPFLDLMKQADSRWGSSEYPAHAYANAAGWLINLPNGVAAQTKRVYTKTVAQGTPFSHIKTGAYKIRWTGDATVTVDASTGISGISSVTTSGGYKYRSFTLDAVPDDIYVRVTNTSGGSASLTDLKMFRAEHESLIDSGEIFEPTFLAGLANARCVRLMDWGGINSLGFNPSQTETVFADIHEEGDLSWAGITSTGRSSCPPSVMAKLGVKLGVPIWVCSPWKATDACMASMAQALYNAGARVVYAEGGNEGWNTAFSAYSWLRDTYAATITVVNASGNPSTDNTDKVACATADISARWWKACEDAGLDVYRVIGTQAATTAFGAFYQFTPTCYGSTKIQDLLNGSRGRVAIAPYFDMATTATITDVSKRGLCDAKSYNLNDSAWQESMQTYITNSVVGWVNSHRTYMQARSPQCTLTSYECGQHVTKADYEPASQISVTVDDVNDELVIVSGSFASSYDDGEQTYLDYTIFNSLGLPTRTPYVKKNGTTRIQLYTDAGLTNRITFGVLAGTYSIDNYTRMLLLDAKIKAVLDGQPGRTLYQNYYDSVFTGKLEHFFHYVSAGIYTHGEQWGLKRSPHDSNADYQRAAWFAEFFASSTGLNDEGGSGGRRSRRRKLFEDEQELYAYMEGLKDSFQRHLEETKKSVAKKKASYEAKLKGRDRPLEPPSRLPTLEKEIAALMKSSASLAEKWAKLQQIAHDLEEEEIVEILWEFSEA